MTQQAWADLSKVLFFPTAMLLYVAAMFGYFYSLAFTKVDREEPGAARAGRRVQTISTVLAVAGATAHLGHLIARSMAGGGRVPWGNMFEYSSTVGFLVVASGLIILQFRMKRPELVGFLLLFGILEMGAALLVWTEPGPLMPILDSNWLKIHVAAIVFAASVFTVGFIFNGLQLLRLTAEERVAAGITARTVGSTVGAAYAGDTLEADDDAAVIAERVSPDDLTVDDDRAYGLALRQAINPFKLVAYTALLAIPFSLMFDGGVSRKASTVLVIGLLPLIAWWALPYLPSASSLDSLAYRTIAFAFPIWTFAVLAGAVWAEQSWGRYWGWDPKETSAFLTWIAYASYLHSRATRGVRGRTAAWIGVGSFGVLLFTYYAVNLIIVGLHSYA